MTRPGWKISDAPAPLSSNTTTATGASDWITGTASRREVTLTASLDSDVGRAGLGFDAHADLRDVPIYSLRVASETWNARIVDVHIGAEARVWFREVTDEDVRLMRGKA